VHLQRFLGAICSERLQVRGVKNPKVLFGNYWNEWE
jgi:hypothetical protein